MTLPGRRDMLSTFRQEIEIMRDQMVATKAEHKNTHQTTLSEPLLPLVKSKSLPSTKNNRLEIPEQNPIPRRVSNDRSVREILLHQRCLIQRQRKSLDDRRQICDQLRHLNTTFNQFKILSHEEETVSKGPTTEIVVESRLPLHRDMQYVQRRTPDINKQEQKHYTVRYPVENRANPLDSEPNNKLGADQLRGEPRLTPNTKNRVENWLSSLSDQDK